MHHPLRFRQDQQFMALWKLAVGLSVEDTSRDLFSGATPLLEEKGNTGVLALLPNRPNPLGLQGSGVRAAFSAHNDPRNAGEVELAEVLQQRLDGKEAHCGWSAL